VFGPDRGACDLENTGVMFTLMPPRSMRAKFAGLIARAEGFSR
jgi:hypothetical protein